MTDTIRTVTESDYTQFGANLTFSVRVDSGKSWILIESLTRLKNGAKEADTVSWVPQDFGIAPGSVRLMVREYDKVHKAVISLTLTPSP